jgi:hypothetical protein
MAYLRQNGLRGLGAYDDIGNWSWLYYPPPYDFLAPADAAPDPPISSAGLGGCGCGGSCGGCGGHGHKHGIGLFDSTDFATWGMGEWATIGVGAYLLFSLIGDTKRVGGRVRKTVKRRSAARSKYEKARSEFYA